MSDFELVSVHELFAGFSVPNPEWCPLGADRGYHHLGDPCECDHEECTCSSLDYATAVGCPIHGRHEDE